MRADALRLGIIARAQRIFVVVRHPQLLRDRELEVRRHHSNHGRGFAINPNGLTNDLPVGPEVALPDFVAENRDLFRARLVVSCGEIAAHDRSRADDAEEIFRDVTASVTLRIIPVADVDG